VNVRVLRVGEEKKKGKGQNFFRRGKGKHPKGGKKKESLDEKERKKKKNREKNPGFPVGYT